MAVGQWLCFCGCVSAAPAGCSLSEAAGEQASTSPAATQAATGKTGPLRPGGALMLGAEQVCSAKRGVDHLGGVFLDMMRIAV